MTLERFGASGDPLALLVPAFEDPAPYRRLARLLSGVASVVLVPEAARPQGAPGLAARAERVAALLEGQSLFPAHLFGASLRAVIALRIAREHPELVRSLVLHEPLLWDLPSLPAETDRERQELARLHAQLVAAPEGPERRRLALRLRRALEAGAPGETIDLDNAEELADALVGRFPDPEPGVLCVPVLVTSGEEAPAWRQAAASALAATVPVGRYERLPGAGPRTVREHPDRLAATIVGFCIERNIPAD